MRSPEEKSLKNNIIATGSLSKLYRLYSTPQDRLKQMALWRFGHNYGHEFWALRNISFQVEKGESIGIIGRNGSGKSTLLQILAGTLAATSGVAKVNGKVAALLELGSGFNPEFTGRENVYLNGSVLGLSRDEIEARFTEITDFAEIGEFIDQPVKIYSSGMFVRLAFAVQTVLPKDVLIVDEALAVGDEAFQRKCYSAIERFREDGGTVLLVSHSAQTIIRHCSRCLLLSHGELLADGPAKPVTDLYQKLMYSPAAEFKQTMLRIGELGLEKGLSTPNAAPENTDEMKDTHAEEQAPGNAVTEFFDPNLPNPPEIVYGTETAVIRDPAMFTQDGKRVNTLVCGRSYEWRYYVDFIEDAHDVSFGFMLKTVDGLMITGSGGKALNKTIPHIHAGQTAYVKFKLNFAIAPGTYFLNSGVSSLINGETIFLHRRVDVAMIRVLSPDTNIYSGFAFVQPRLQVEIKETPSL